MVEDPVVAGFRIERGQLRLIDEAARADGVGRSAFIRTACLSAATERLLRRPANDSEQPAEEPRGA